MFFLTSSLVNTGRWLFASSTATFTVAVDDSWGVPWSLALIRSLKELAVCKTEERNFGAQFRSGSHILPMRATRPAVRLSLPLTWLACSERVPCIK